MIQLLYSPYWFFGKDIFIDLVSMIILMMIALFALRWYKVKKKKSYFALAGSFLMMAVAFICKIATNFTIYYRDIDVRKIGFVTFTFHTIKSTNTLYFVGFMLYRLLTLLGLYVLYSIYLKKQPRSNIMLITYLLIISVYFTQSVYYIFHISAFLLLFMITLQYWKNYKLNKLKTSLMLMLSFLLIALTQIIFIFVRLWLPLYVFAEVIQLIGYAVLLVMFFMVLRHGKKKQDRHHL